MTTKNFLNRASWIILVLLLIPAGAVQASKDAIPGDSIYSVKLVLEDALLFMMKPSQAATSDMEVRFTKRRLLEVEQVADTVFVVESLKSLNEQVADTAISIGKVKNLTKQSELANKYIQTLQETQASLERQRLAANNSVGRAARSGSGQATSSVDADEIRRQIEQTKADIAAEIERLRQVALANERIKQQQILENERARQAAEQAAQQAQQDAQAAQAAQAAAEAAAQQAQDDLAAQQAAAEAAAQAAAQAAAEAEAEAQETEDDEHSNDNQGQGQGQGQGDGDDDGNSGDD